jgi:3',5'-cyclic AMP phosphodiesterase CpdA
MRRLLHLSDLHFGRDRPELLEPLVTSVNSLTPDIVVISGDFTQRARRSQFAEARAFLQRLKPLTLSVPGNHDTPLDNFAIRLLQPWDRYRRYIDHDLEPTFSDDEMIVAGVNTANPLSWQRGRIRSRAVARVCEVFDGRHGRRMRVLALHHPLEHLPDLQKRLMRGANKALATLGDCGADIVLSGHLHTWRVEPFAAAGGVLLVQAGTGLSTRHKGEPNDFNLLTIDGKRLTVDRHAAKADASGFELLTSQVFRKEHASWTTDAD